MIASVQNDLVIDGDNSLDNSSSNTIFVLSEIYENAKKGIFNPKKFSVRTNFLIRINIQICVIHKQCRLFKRADA